jgi:hypothetical protein
MKSLGRFTHAQDAHDLVSSVYVRFAEGFETAIFNPQNDASKSRPKIAHERPDAA